MSRTGQEKSLQRFLAEAARQFRGGVGPAAQQAFELLTTVDAETMRARARALTVDELAEPVPEEMHPLLQASPPTPCLDAIRAIYRSLVWYRSARSNMPYAQIVGPGSMLARDDVRMGLFMLHAASDYPDHVHGADEVYIVLTGSAEWSLNGRAYETKVAGDIIEVPSMTVHALRTFSDPALTLWSWTGDITMDRYRFT